MVDRTTCVINVDGQNVTSAILPRLINLSISDKAGGSSDTVSIVLDDDGGSILLPRARAVISVLLGSASGAVAVFNGLVDEVKSSGARSSGMTLTISGKGFDTQGKPKEPQEKHWDDADLQTVFTEAAQRGGIAGARVDPTLAQIIRPYWAMQGESFIHFAERIAREVGATFKVSNNIAVLAKRNGGLSASGLPLSIVTATRSVNLISWDVAPVIGRPRYMAAKVRWYDAKTATWKVQEVGIADPGADAGFTSRFSAADEDEATQNAESRKADSERGKGGGSVAINGSGLPQPEGLVILAGVRPGIDGAYRIDTVTQDFSRSGWVTRLDVKQPQDGAGTDSRAG